jgi:GAF domain-containing protein
MINAINSYRYFGLMEDKPEPRFNEEEILDRILEAIEENGNIIERTVEILNELKHYDWVGIYLVDGEELVLNHYIGRPTEHTRIRIGSGICGAAVVDERTIVVPDVCSDGRYIACSQETRSEIVVPIWSSNRIIGEIDVDSDLPDAFDSSDVRLLERIASVLGDVI